MPRPIQATSTASPIAAGAATAPAIAHTVRVAIYCRKSVTDGLNEEFNSLDAQRASAEAYIQSQAHVGWVAIEKHYDDGGFSGSNTARPAFQQLLGDIEAGLVDCVIVYRLDRMSRNVADHVAILQLFEEHDVTFVSVSEQFNTTTPTGRLVLNQLATFAQFEREVIGERIRDKVRATRRRGEWTGGRLVLGYNLEGKRLVVNEDEAHQVRGIFELYLQRGSIRETLTELDRRGWRNKSFTNKRGEPVAGNHLTRTSLHRLLTNVLYRGQLRCGDEVAPGIHEPIIEQDLWDAVQARLKTGSEGKSKKRNRTGALLRGLVACGRCGSPMLHTFTTKSNRRYAYYVCARTHNEGADCCPGARISAGSFERHVVEQIKVIGNDPGLLAQTAESAESLSAKSRDDLQSERRRIEQERRRISAQRETLLSTEPPSTEDAKPLLDKVGELDARLVKLEQREDEVHAELRAIDEGLDDSALGDALEGFLPIWDQLFPLEQDRILRLLIETVTYDPDTKDIEIDLRDCGIDTLADEARKTS